MRDRDPGTILCPVDDCDAGPWPDTYGHDGGRRKRMTHLYAEHDDRTLPWSRIDRL
jgi:hypothetical protein